MDPFDSESLTVEVPLGGCPRLVSTGVSVHGSVPVERFRLARVWCLHLYRYDAELRIGGASREIRPGTVSLIPAGVDLTYRFGGRSEHTYAHFAVASGGAEGADAVRRVPMVQHVEAGRFTELEHAMREGVGWFGAEPRRSAVRLWDVLWRVAGGPIDTGLLPGGLSPGGSGPGGARPGEVGDVGERCVQRLLAAIELRLSEPLRVGELVEGLGLERSYNQVLRLFRRRTGRSIAGYIRQRRVARAVHLLRHTSSPIKVVAIQVGVPDLQAFNKLIRKATGQSPRALRGGAK